MPIRSLRAVGDARPASFTFRQLKWIGILVPALLLLVFFLSAEFLFDSWFHSPIGYITTTGFVLAGVYVFAEIVFGVVHRLDEELVKQNERLEVSAAVATSLSAARSRDESLQTILGLILDSLSLDAGVICLLDEGPEELFASAQRGLPPPLYEAVKRAKLDSDAVGAEVIRAGRPVVIPDAATDARVKDVARDYGFHSIASIPLLAEDRALGVLALTSRHSNRFEASDVRWLEQLASQMGVAVERAALVEQVLGRNKVLALLNETASALTRTLEVDRIADIILHRIVEVSGGSSASLWLNAGDGTQPSRLVHAGCEAGVLKDDVPPGATDLPAGSRTARAEGQGEKGQMRLSLRSDRQEFGHILAEGFRPEALTSSQRDTLRAIVDQGATALQNALLHERIRELAIVEERERIARELHDGLAQVLGYVNTKAFAIRRLLNNGDSHAAEAMLAQLEEAAREVYSDVREGVLALRTASPDDGGLDEGICAYAAQFEQMTGIEVRCEVADEADLRRLPEMTDLQVLRIVQEALSNVRKHAEAGSVTIRMVVRGATLRIAVIDDGCGFETEGIGSADSQQFGLRTMRERAEAIGGTLKVLSRRGEGTTVTVEVPVETWVGVEL